MPLRYYKPEDYTVLNVADDLKTLLPIALRVLQRMKDAGCKEVFQVCGPITTGGKGSVAENLVEIDKTICELVEQGKAVFNQMPFEGAMVRVHRKWKEAGNTTYNLPILDDFYLPIMESGIVNNLVFLPDWKSSRGAQWEHEQGKRLGYTITYL